MHVRLLGAEQAAPAHPTGVLPSGGFWSTVGNILSTRGVVEVKQKTTDKTVAYVALGLAAIGTLFIATKA